MTSSYVINRAPVEMYGGQQEDYIARKNCAIGRNLKLLQNDDHTDLEALFKVILEDFACERREIALLHGSIGAGDFGIRRRDGEFFAFTHLAGPYKSYGERLKPLIEESGVMPTKAQLDEKNLGSTYCNLLGKRFRRRDFRLWAPGGPTRYLMAKGGDAIIIHQSSDLSPQAINELSKLFEKAVRGESLVEAVARLRYKFSHSLLFNRGSAAIAEWFETLIYHYHGFENFSYNSDKAVDLEALIEPNINLFLENYSSMVNFIN